MKRYTASNKAYYDSFTGLIPCKVVDTDNNGNVTVEFTVHLLNRVQKGERYTCKSHWVYPRCEVSIRGGMFVRSTFYAWIKPENGIKNIRTR